MGEKDPDKLFDLDEYNNIDLNYCKEHSINMPEYDNVEETPPVITATFKFSSVEDYELFIKIITSSLYNGEKPFDGMQRKDIKSTWYPHKKKHSRYIYEDDNAT